jgi:hypothetical protein
MGNIPVGHRFSMVAMALLNKLESKESAGEVMCLVSRVKCLVEPLQALSDLQAQAESASLLAGDLQYARLNRFFRCSNMFWAGVNVANVNEEVSRAIPVFKEQDHSDILTGLMIFQWVFSTLLGNEAEVELKFDPEKLEKTPRIELNW